MITAFTTALSALSADSTAIDIVGNNLANLNTTGYKATTAAFHDLMNQQLGTPLAGTEVGLGVAGVQTVRQFTQGAIQQSTGPFDSAIQGDGFFIVRDQNNEMLYTRAGNFTVDATGHLVSATGQNVQGWSATNGVLNLGSPIGDIVVPVNGVSTGTPTTQMSMTVNLNAGASTGPTSVYSAPIQVVDSQGGKHTLTVTFTKTAANAWDFSVTIPNSDLASPATAPLATGSLQFDSNGLLTSPATGSPVDVQVIGLADGAADMDISWNLYNGSNGLLTQLQQASGISGTTQDGNTGGQISKVSMADGGIIIAQYSNGSQVKVGQVALASIQNPGTLRAVGNNNLLATVNTAPAAIGPAGTGGRGDIQAGALENSTVDVATEFANLITLQRSYQAASRVITTTDQMTQDLIGLIR